MFHPGAQALIDYWTARASGGRAPARETIDPGELHHVLNQVFMVGRTARGRYPLRLAGDLLVGLHGEDLHGRSLLTLWSERDRPRLEAALEEIRRTPAPLVVMAEALTDGPSLSMEVVFAPLAVSAAGVERYLGLYQPLALPSRLQGRPVRELAVRALRRTASEDLAVRPLRLAAFQGRRIA